jgi:hypothetical protein
MLYVLYSVLCSGNLQARLMRYLPAKKSIKKNGFFLF